MFFADKLGPLPKETLAPTPFDEINRAKEAKAAAAGKSGQKAPEPEPKKKKGLFG